MKGIIKDIREMFREHQDPKVDRQINICFFIVNLFIIILFLLLYHGIAALIVFGILGSVTVCFVQYLRYKQWLAKNEVEKETKKRRAYEVGTLNLMKKPLSKLSNALSLAPTENYGFSEMRYRYADDILIFVLKFMRMPDAVELDMSAAERYRQVLNSELWNTDPQIYGDCVDFPLYVSKVFEGDDGVLYFRVIPCINEKTHIIVKEYDRQRQEKAAREREEIKQALARLKL